MGEDEKEERRKKKEERRKKKEDRLKGKRISSLGMSWDFYNWNSK
ncbi:hypothetical protein [Flavobacterium sp. WC2430]